MNAREWVNSHIGVPWVLGGREHDAFDCFGLIVLYYRDVKGVELPDWDSAEKSKRWIVDTLNAAHKTIWEVVSEPQDGDIVAALSVHGTPFHVGLFWQGGVLHSQYGVGCAYTSMPVFKATYPKMETGRIQCQQ